jgi:hypothetical protein
VLELQVWATIPSLKKLFFFKENKAHRTSIGIKEDGIDYLVT